MEELLKDTTMVLASVMEFSAAIVIGLASIRAFFNYFKNFFIPQTQHLSKEEIRLTLGRSLALALEFLLGADILKTAIAPNWNDVGMLAAIAILRTALNYFLERELRNAEVNNAS